jgi:hypothetical protein
MGFGAVIENVRKNFIDEDSPEYNSQRATPVWSNVLLFFDQELMEDRSSLPSDQVGIQFCKLSTGEKEHYLARMKSDPSFSKEAVRGFYAFAMGQLDEDKTVFEAFRSDPDLAREHGESQQQISQAIPRERSAHSLMKLERTNSSQRVLSEIRVCRWLTIQIASHSQPMTGRRSLNSHSLLRRT